MTIKITKAEWDLRGKTKFLRIEGEVGVNSPFDKVEVSHPEAIGISPHIAVCHVTVIDSNGPMKPQPLLFQEVFVTIGDEGWTHLQITNGEESYTLEISVLTWASSLSAQPLGVGGDSGGPE